MEKSLLIKFLGENPIFRIIDFLIENKGLDVTKKEIIEGAGISKSPCRLFGLLDARSVPRAAVRGLSNTLTSRASLFNCWKQLEEQEIVKVKRQFGKTKLYALNSENPIVKKLLELESVLIGKALEKHELAVKVYG